ncbi:MAG: cbb3-type cytochrome c oxidase N-terminal domain-containing protein [Ginsengibacter sp.]
MKILKIIIAGISLFAALPAWAQTGEVSSAKHPVAITMLIIIGLLAGVIFLMGKTLIAGYSVHKERLKKATSGSAPLLIAGLLLSSQISFARQATEVIASTPVSHEWVTGLDNSTFLILISVIALELIIILYMATAFRSFVKIEKAKPVKVKQKKFSWLEKLNNTRTVDSKSEDAYNLGHNYDGIQELDNPTPPWWQWGFVLSVVFGVIYLWVYFVSHSAPNQIKELEIANTKAEEQIKAYMASSANKIDENTVTLLEDAADIGVGKKIFSGSCAPCHGSDGGGVVGPNLTDNYWLHGGTIHDIFKTIKNGVPEKGMKSWKDDFTPKQIAQLASYIVSIKGTKPANPKEPQGELVE